MRGADFQALWDWLNANTGAVTAMAALIAALVTGIYSFFTMLLWFATRRQAKLTLQMIEASHTPFVSIRVEELRDTSEEGVLSFNIVFENQSAVLAHIIKWEMHATLTDLELQNHSLAHIDLIRSPADGTLAPGQERVIEPRFYDKRLPSTDLPFRIVGMLAYRGSGPSVCITDFEAYRGNANKAWTTQHCRMRRPEDMFWAALGYKPYW